MTVLHLELIKEELLRNNQFLLRSKYLFILVGKAAIEEALRSNHPHRVIEKITEVCTNEGLSKLGCVQAAYYCSKAVLKGSSELIRGAYTNLLV
jgi:hypothetical protein